MWHGDEPVQRAAADAVGDAAVERVNQAGGQVQMGPHEVPGGQWVIQGVDPQGANFALLSNTK